MADESRPARLLTFLDERTGLPSALRRTGASPSPAGSGLRIGVGSALFAILALVLTSGVGLALHYSPSTTHAWASIAYLERELPFGKLTRALHYQGTNALLVGMSLQLILTAAHGAYRRPREVSWWLSLAALGLVFASAMTGALLPWDEQGYWASRVETGIMASAPVVGPFIRELAQGGNDFGHLMLTRYYALHAIVVPTIIVTVVGLQLSLLRKHGAAARETMAPGDATFGTFAGSGGFFAAFGAFVGAVALILLAVKFGAPIDGPADPSGGFPPRPAWYFRALFELRRHFEGPLEPIATMVLPGLASALLVALPFLDRADKPRRHAAIVGGLVVGLGLAGVATWISFHRDASDQAYQAAKAASAKRGEKAFALAAQGVPPQGPLFMVRNTPDERGRKIYVERCAGCHPTGEAMEKPKGPDLAGWAGEAWLTGAIAHPEAREYFGATKVKGMDPYDTLGKERLQLLARFVASLKHQDGRGPDALPADLQPGRKAFEDEGCDNCHSLKQDESSGAPTLHGYASDRWIAGLLMEPGAEHYFGADNDMPSYRGKFDDRQVADLIVYLRTLEPLQPAYDLKLATTNH